MSSFRAELQLPLGTSLISVLISRPQVSIDPSRRRRPHYDASGDLLQQYRGNPMDLFHPDQSKTILGERSGI
jgi:hypothetical protein